MSAKNERFILYRGDPASKGEAGKHRAATGPWSEIEASVIAAGDFEAVVAVVDRDKAKEWDKGCERCAQVRTS